MPGFLGEAVAAPASAASGVIGDHLVARSGAGFSWGSRVITAAGGDYRLCWCAPQAPSTGATGAPIAQPVPCVREEDFVDVGTLTVVAPTRGSWTCVAGTTCLLDTRPGAATDVPLGHHLAVGDALYVMDTCGTFPASRFPRVDVVDPASAWSLAEVTAFGGQYRLCWCAATYACESAAHFHFDVGEVLLEGPQPLVRTCISGQTCRFNPASQAELAPCLGSGLACAGLPGTAGVAAGDQLFVLETCGTSNTLTVPTNTVRFIPHRITSSSLIESRLLLCFLVSLLNYIQQATAAQAAFG